MKHQNFLDWNYKILVNSLKKIDFNIILIVLLDALFYLFSIFIFNYLLKTIFLRMASINLPQGMESLPLDKLQLIVKDSQNFFYMLILSFVLVMLAMIFLASIIKCIIWAKTTKTKITLKLISKFFILNLAWMGFWLALIVAIAFFVDQYSVALFSYIALFLGIYFTNSLYSIFIKNPTFKAVKQALKLSTQKIHLFILPYVLIFLVLYIIIKLSSLPQSQYLSFMFAIVLLLCLAAFRYYISGLVFELKKTHDF